MTLKEVQVHLQTEGINSDWRLQAFEGVEKNQREVLFPEYFARIPTPVIRLKFSDGKLVDWKM